MKKILEIPFFIRLFHWEFWPFHVVYAITYPYWLWLCIKAKSFFFYSAANPTIKNGGFLMESKKDIYDLIPKEFYPQTLLFKAGSSPGDVWQQLTEAEFSFPVIGKPDVGLRGIAVKKLENRQEVNQYVLNSKVNFLIQQFVSFEKEAGVFYYRYPKEKNGFISGIVLKEFVNVEGDGVSTIGELLGKNKRYILQLKEITKQYPKESARVLPKGERKILVPYGNHSRGAKFIDASNLVDDRITKTIDEVCKRINGFYYGRMDIRFDSWEELMEGKNFSIIELNGAGSEPTHIYDPKHSIFFAWREIIRHAGILYRISKQNKERCPYMQFSNGVKMFRENSSYMKQLESGEIRA